MKNDTAVNQTTTTLVDNDSVARFLPRVCLLCGGNCGNPVSLCPGCIADLPRPEFACPVCALPMPENMLCAKCLNNKRPVLNRTTALFNYRYPINLIIQNIKFQADLVAACNMGQLVANHLLKESIALPECIVPVPQHPLRLAQRGYNQALEIARPIAKTLGLPLDTTVCRRIRHTQSQTKLSTAERKRNLRSAFEMKNKNNYRHIAIVDDVMTTGSTITELAKIFCATGTTYIQAWVCARASR